MLSGTTSVAERADMLQAFKDWLEGHGLRSAPTRLARYLKTLQQVAEKDKLSDEEYDNYIFTLREADELIWVYHGLKHSVPPGALPLLEASLGGAELARVDRRSSARNALFELRIASYFLQAGFSVDVSGPADLVVDTGPDTVYIECKRLESERKVKARASEAFKQLKHRLNHADSRRCYGIAVLDVGQIIHPQQGLSAGTSRIHLRDGLRHQLLAFADYFDVADIFRREKRILSVWLQVLTPAVHIEELEVATRFSSVHLPLVGEAGPRAEVFQQLRKAFELGG